jgi:carbamoyl-phosphate synthase large subunit
VLITGVGGTAGQSVTKAVGLMKEKTRIIGADMNPESAGLYFVDKSYAVPPADNPDFVPALIDICNRERIDVLIPTVDEELLPLSLASSLFEKKGTKLLLASNKVLRTTLDKWETYRVLHETGIPTIPSLNSGSREEILGNLGLPLIIKPRRGRGGRGIIKLEDAILFDYCVSKVRDPIFQKCLTGDEYTVDAVVGKDGHVFAVVPKKRIEMRGGSTYKALTVNSPELRDISLKIVDLLKATGPLNIQFIIDQESGAPNVLEINPRFSSTLCLTVDAGVNSVEILLWDLLGEELADSYSYREGLCMLRYWANVVVHRSNLIGETD